MRLHRGVKIVTVALLAGTLVAGAGQVDVASGQAQSPVAQPKGYSAAAPKAASRKKPVRRVVKPKAQAAPTRERIVEIQAALGREGFYQGTPSGTWDVGTTQAMRDFQSAKGLSATGKLGALSLQKLGLGSEIAGRGAPAPQTDARPSALSESDLSEADDPPAN